MKKRWVILSIAATGLGIAIAIALVAPASAMRPGEAVALLDSSPSATAPQLAYVDNFRLQAQTVRFAGSTKDQQFWVGVDVAGKVCIVTTAGTPETGGAACAPADVVKSSGVMLGLTPDRASGLDEFIVYLLPDSVDVSTVAAPWHSVGGNVVVVDASAARAADVVTLSRDDGGMLALVP